MHECFIIAAVALNQPIKNILSNINPRAQEASPNRIRNHDEQNPPQSMPFPAPAPHLSKTPPLPYHTINKPKPNTPETLHPLPIKRKRKRKRKRCVQEEGEGGGGSGGGANG